MTSLAALAAAALLLPVLTLGATQLPADPPARAEPLPENLFRSDPGGAEPEATEPGESRPPPDRPPAPPAPSPAAVEGTPIGRWSWPLSPRPRVVRGFAIGPTPWSPGHRGVDLALTGTGPPDLPAGTVVRAPADGTVRFTGVIAGRPVLSITHADGLISSFEPVINPLPPGQIVRQGQVLGRPGGGPGHCAPASCLHWGVRRHGRYIDPLLLVPGHRGPAVLLPLPRAAP